jgi:hypothetical protein
VTIGTGPIVVEIVLATQPPPPADH